MPRFPIPAARLAVAVLIALALPLSAQDAAETAGEAAVAEEAAAETVVGEEAASEEAAAEEVAAAPAEPTTAATDPSVLDAEILPRASRSMLLDAARTTSGYVAVGERGHVLVSDDAKTWRQAKVPTRSTLTSVATVDGVIWAAGHDGVIVHSTDGGQTWTRRRASPWSYDIVDPSEGVPVMDLLFTDASNGIAIGAYNLMLVTSDGGVTWTPRSVSGDAPVDVAEEEAADTGEAEDWTFDESDLMLDAESDPHLNAIARTGSGALVIAGERGAFLRSRDGGETWESRRLPYEGSMFGVLAWEDDHILVFGLRGNVYESTDLGTSWTRVETGIGTSLMGGHALPGGGAVLVGANGMVLSRPDAASPFVTHAFETGNGETPLLAGVLPVGDSGYLVVGDKGADLYTPQ